MRFVHARVNWSVEINNNVSVLTIEHIVLAQVCSIVLCLPGFGTYSWIVGVYDQPGTGNQHTMCIYQQLIAHQD